MNRLWGNDSSISGFLYYNYHICLHIKINVDIFKLWIYIHGMKNAKTGQQTVPFSMRITLDSRDRLDRLAAILSEKLGDQVTRVQAFNVAIKEALERRQSDEKESS